MSNLNTKSSENIKLVEYVLEKGEYLNYHPLAGRIYYAVFQKIKYHLKSNNYDYDHFLNSIGQPRERPYSHGTIKRALLDYISSEDACDDESKRIISRLDFLYRKRRSADYEDLHISKRDISVGLSYSKDIIDMIDGRL